MPMKRSMLALVAAAMALCAEFPAVSARTAPSPQLSVESLVVPAKKGGKCAAICEAKCAGKAALCDMKCMSKCASR
jgi:hypothetical protein